MNNYTYLKNCNHIYIYQSSCTNTSILSLNHTKKNCFINFIIFIMQQPDLPIKNNTQNPSWAPVGTPCWLR